MISASGMCGAISFEASIISTAPMAKFDATKQLAPPLAASTVPRSSSRSKPVLPTTAWTPASTAAITFPGAASGVVKSTITSASAIRSATALPREASARSTSSRSPAASTAAQAASPMRPAAPETRTLIASAIVGDLMCVPSSGRGDERIGPVASARSAQLELDPAAGRQNRARRHSLLLDPARLLALHLADPAVAAPQPLLTLLQRLLLQVRHQAGGHVVDGHLAVADPDSRPADHAGRAGRGEAASAAATARLALTRLDPAAATAAVVAAASAAASAVVRQSTAAVASAAEDAARSLRIIDARPQPAHATGRQGSGAAARGVGAVATWLTGVSAEPRV